MNWGVSHLAALALGFILDLIFGDPRWLPHPIRAIGVLLRCWRRFCERFLQKRTGENSAAGIFLVVLTCSIVTAAVFGIIWVLSLISLYLAFAVEVFLSYQILATRALKDESMRVYHDIKSSDIQKARYSVSMIVGRDTESLDEIGIVKATVETVAENASDGVIAPIIFMAIGGVPLGMFYKAVNTMDSMVGYKNDRYLYFGRAAAIWDDVLNFIPARLSGILMCAAAMGGGGYENFHS